MKSTGVLVAGSMMPHFADGQPPLVAARTNWSGNLTYSTSNLQTPGTLDDLRQLIKSSTKLRALGSRHSFNAIADSKYEQVSLARLADITLDEHARTVTVGGGVTYSLVAPYLDARGYALHNLASLPGITVPGACATATHGSGVHNGNLATAVAAVEFIAADGSVIHLSRAQDGDKFLGAVVGLGALGVVTHMTLDVQPTYQVAQSVYQNLSFDQVGRNFDAIFQSGYSVSLFTDWQNHQATQVWIKKRLGAGYSGNSIQWPQQFYEATLAKQKLHPIAGHPAESCTDQQGIPGPWYDRLPHFRIGQTPSSGHELQTEYLVPYEHGFEAVLAVEKLRDQITPHLFVTELRTIAPDHLWISTAHERPSLAIHFTWKPEWPAVSRILPKIEAQLKPFAPRPHWGKLFTLPSAELDSRYARLKDFQALVSEYDPQGKFRNEFVATNLYAS
ncbi:MAG TPA: D-arabinono-1,4-lactone oxidase [Terracidiphilus sp.]